MRFYQRVNGFLAAGLCAAILFSPVFSQNGNIAAAQALPFNFVKQWQPLPQESLASLVERPAVHIVGSDISRLDEGMVVSVVYLENTGSPKALYRCVEYVREWQFETIQANCFMAIVPQPTTNRK